MRISDWSSDVCSSDLARAKNRAAQGLTKLTVDSPVPYLLSDLINAIQTLMGKLDRSGEVAPYMRLRTKIEEIKSDPRYSFMFSGMLVSRSEEHTSELQSLMRISYAVFCLTKKKI